MELREGSPEEAGIRPETVEQIQSRAKQWVAEGSTPALVLLAARSGVIFLHEAFGKHSPEEGAASLAKNALFPLASLSKMFTATAAMCLVEDGLLGLNRPVQEYIPEFAGVEKNKVMVHQLLTHTSGIQDDPWEMIIEEEGETAEIPPPEPTMNPRVNEFLYYLFKAPLSLTPGKEMYYADANYYLVGELVRRLSGKSLEQFSRERIFGPMGMNDSYFEVPEVAQDRVVRRPEGAHGSGYQDREFMERPSPSGGAYSTALDMAKFGQVFLNGGAYGSRTVLSPAGAAAMTTDQIPGVGASFIDFSFPFASWGLGWSVGAAFKGRVYGELLPAPGYFNHGGYGGVEMWLDPAREIAGIYFSVSLAVDSRDFSIQDADLYMNLVTAGVIDDRSAGPTPSLSGRESEEPRSANVSPSIRVGERNRNELVLEHGRPEEVGADPARLKKVVDLAKGWVESGVHPSLRIVAARHGLIFLDESFGHMGPEVDAKPVTPTTLFPLASITKPITAAAAMILVEEGAVSLNRPVTEYLPEIRGEGQDKVLIRHLLTHTSGLQMADVLELAKGRGQISNSDPSDRNLAYLFSDHSNYMELVREISPVVKPDQKMIYAACNYDLLAEVIASASGTTYPEFVRKRIFKQLGMDDSFIMLPRIEKARVVRRPGTAPYEKVLTTLLESRSPFANGGFSTANDISILGQMFLNGGSYGGVRILSQASVEAMTKDQVPGIMTEYEGEEIGRAEWGLGWSIHETVKSWAYGEPLLSRGSFCQGGVGGVFVWVDPVKDLVAVFFSTYVSMTKDGRPAAATDLFINSVLASITDA